MPDLNTFGFDNYPIPQIPYGWSVFSFPFTFPRILTWSAEDFGGGNVKLIFARALRSLAATTNAANYTITGPTIITVDAVSFTPGNDYVVLDTDGTFAAGNYYTVTMAPQTAQAQDDDEYNSTNISQFVSFGTAVGGGSGGSKLNSGFA